MTSSPLRWGLATLASLLVFVGVARPVTGQEISSPYRFIDKRQAGGLFVGYRSADTGRFGYGPKPSMTFGALYDIEVAGPLGFDVVVTMQPTERDVIDPDLPENARVTGSADVLLTSVEALLRIALPGRRTWHGISPHFLVGGGVMFESKGENGDDTRVLEDDRFKMGTSFIANLGGGLRWFPTERVTLRGDVGFSLWQLETPPGFADPARAFEGVEETEWVGTPTFRLTASLRF